MPITADPRELSSPEPDGRDVPAWLETAKSLKDFSGTRVAALMIRSYERRDVSPSEFRSKAASMKVARLSSLNCAEFVQL